MKISTRLRYGTRLMLELAMNYGDNPMYLKEIAKSQNVSQKYLSQIIIPLKNAGLVNSFRGARGGYVLSRDPEQISMREIVQVLEGDFSFLQCIKKPSSCERVSACATRGIWYKIGRTIYNMLDCMSLAELVAECTNKQQNLIAYNI